MEYALLFLALIAVAALLAIAASTVSMATAVERLRIQREAEMAEHWNFPPDEPPLVLTGYDQAVPGSDFTASQTWIQGSAGLRLVEGDAPNWRNALPARSAG